MRFRWALGTRMHHRSTTNASARTPSTRRSSGTPAPCRRTPSFRPSCSEWAAAFREPGRDCSRRLRIASGLVRSALCRAIPLCIEPKLYFAKIVVEGRHGLNSIQQRESRDWLIEFAMESTDARGSGRHAVAAADMTTSTSVPDRYASTVSGTRWISLRPDLGSGRGKGWAMPLASIVRQHSSYCPAAGAVSSAAQWAIAYAQRPGQRPSLGVELARDGRQAAVGQAAAPTLRRRQDLGVPPVGARQVRVVRRNRLALRTAGNTALCSAPTCPPGPRP